MDNSPEIWLPSGDPEVLHYEKFKKHFGNDSFIGLVSAELNLQDTTVKEQLALLQSKLDTLAHKRKLETPLDPQGELLDEPGSGHLLSKSGKRLVFLLFLEDDTTPAQALELIKSVEETAAEHTGLGTFSLVGTEIVTRDLNRGSEQSFGRLFPLVAFVLSIVVYLALRSVQMVLAILISAVASILSAVGTMALFGASMNLLVVLMPAILIVLTVAAAVHLCQSYLNLSRLESQETLSQRVQLWEAAVNKTFKPCALATTTTALGFLSLAVSKVGPVRDLGLFTAVGALWVLLSVFVLIPQYLCVHKFTREKKTRALSLTSYVAGVCRFRILIILAGLVCFVVASFGLPRLRLESNIMEFFPKTHALPRASEDFEENFFGLTSFEALLTGPAAIIGSGETIESL